MRLNKKQERTLKKLLVFQPANKNTREASRTADKCTQLTDNFKRPQLKFLDYQFLKAIYLPIPPTIKPTAEIRNLKFIRLTVQDSGLGQRKLGICISVVRIS